MNNRIRELAHEAGLPTYNPDGIPTKLEKFAELIVAECMEVCRQGKYNRKDDLDTIQFDNGIRFCINAIDNHFGD